MARVLVTGGAGFIGSHLVDLLLDGGHEVTVFDDFSFGRWENLADAWGGRPVPPPPGISMNNFWTRSPDRPLTILPGTVTWGPNITDVMALAQPEVVFHLAAQIDVRTSAEHPLIDAETNVIGTLRMLKASAAAGVRRFVFVSSAAVFGDYAPPADISPRGGMRVGPISPYGASKAAADLYVELYDRMGVIGHHNMCTSTVVLSNAYGPRQRPTFGAVNLFARKLLAGKPVTIYGDGGNVRDYVYVADAARALVAAAEPPVGGRTLVGTGVGTTDRQLLGKVAAEVVMQTGQTMQGGREPAQAEPARAADIRSMVFPRYDDTMTPLDEGIRLTVAAIRKELGL